MTWEIAAGVMAILAFALTLPWQIRRIIAPELLSIKENMAHGEKRRDEVWQKIEKMSDQHVTKEVFDLAMEGSTQMIRGLSSRVETLEAEARRRAD